MNMVEDEFSAEMDDYYQIPQQPNQPEILIKVENIKTESPIIKSTSTSNNFDFIPEENIKQEKEEFIDIPNQPMINLEGLDVKDEAKSSNGILFGDNENVQVKVEIKEEPMELNINPLVEVDDDKPSILKKSQIHEKTLQNTNSKKVIRISKKNEFTTKIIEQQHRCYICEIICGTYPELKKHEFEHHNFTSDDKTCRICQKSFVQNHDLKKHIKRLHTDIKNHQCDQCELAFGISGDLQLHMRKVHGLESHKSKKKMFTCDWCDSTFSAIADLKRHCKSVHEKSNKNKDDLRCFLCDENKTFASTSEVVEHTKKAHQGVQIMMCELCDKIFRQPSSFNKHVEMVHENQRNQKCDSCGKSFYTPYSLKLHIKAVHQRLKDKFCLDCGKAFSDPSNLKKHQLTCANEKGKLLCEFCDKAFLYPSNLKRHLNTCRKK